MDIYLAGSYSRPYCVTQHFENEGGVCYCSWRGGVQANLKPIFQEGFKKYLSIKGNGVDVFWKCVNEVIAKKKGSPQMGGSQMGGSQMDLYLAGAMYGNQSRAVNEMQIQNTQSISILESFYYADDFTEKMIPFFGKFLLDSGAFTFMTSQKNAAIKWDAYVERFADFINRNKIDLFFELDIDSIVGIKEVERLRRKLEKLTSKQPIPVWHKSRGKDYFLRMCDEYKYVSIGGIVSKEITKDQYRFFPWFIDEAHKRKTKIHGLGFTVLGDLKKYHFDSVDSTSWTTGNRFGFIYKFNGHTMIKYDKGEGRCLKDSRAVAINNFNEWVKFQKYAINHL